MTLCPRRTATALSRRCCEHFSESVSTGVWCVPGFGAGFEIALEPSELQKEGENPAKGHLYFLRQTLVCTKPWFKRDLNFDAPQTRGGLVALAWRYGPSTPGAYTSYLSPSCRNPPLSVRPPLKMPDLIWPASLSAGNSQVNLVRRLAARAAINFTGVSGPSGPKIAKKKSQKGSCWGSTKKSPKNPQKVKKGPKESDFQAFLGSFFDFLGYFRGLLADPQETLFETSFFVILGPETPLNGGSGRKRRRLLD